MTNARESIDDLLRAAGLVGAGTAFDGGQRLSGGQLRPPESEAAR